MTDENKSGIIHNVSITVDDKVVVENETVVEPVVCVPECEATEEGGDSSQEEETKVPETKENEVQMQGAEDDTKEETKEETELPAEADVLADDIDDLEIEDKSPQDVLNELEDIVEPIGKETFRDLIKDEKYSEEVLNLISEFHKEFDEISDDDPTKQKTIDFLASLGIIISEPDSVCTVEEVKEEDEDDEKE